MKFEYLLCLLFVISSASLVSDARARLMKKIVAKPSSLRSASTMSTNPQSKLNLCC